MTRNPSHQFHGYLDAKAPAINLPGFGKTERLKRVLVVTRDSKLLYRFSPHFHPYVADLVRRLLESSMSGLQSADTEYETIVKLAGAAKGTSETPEDGEIEIPAGESLRVADGTRIQLKDASFARLAGFKVVTAEDETLDDLTVELQRDEEITLPALTAVTRPDGAVVKLQIDTPVTVPDGKPRPVLFGEIFTGASYAPVQDAPTDATHGVFVSLPHPVMELDFSAGGAYAGYNWEVFYHAPLTIAMHLSNNQRFEDAQRWFHYIFDPTDDSEQSTPERFWKVKPFQYTDVKMIEEILVNLSTGENKELQESTVSSIEAWKDAPFRPHVIARERQSAFMFKAVMAYLDNLIAWGDTLFRQDTGETLNEATQLYVLAANILGPRPQAVPKKGSIQPETYANIRQKLDAFGNALVDLESDILFDLCPHPGELTKSDSVPPMQNLGRALYFCVPPNDKLMSYWSTVEDRLFKLRNSLNLQGMFRQLPLFEPPIDPALLARAVASGLDVGAIVNGLNQPLPLVRFQFLVQKAAEICQEVKSLGAGLLSAIEKEDNEALAVLRAGHERTILGLAEVVRYSQWQEAIKAREGLEVSLAMAVQRYTYYERLLGKEESEIKVPELEALDTQELAKMRKAFRISEPVVLPKPIGIDISSDGAGGKKISSHEAEELEKLRLARYFSWLASGINATGAILASFPNLSTHVQPMGCGVSVKFGGDNFALNSEALASAAQAISAEFSYEAGNAARVATYARREQEWTFQSNQAGAETTQVFKQLRAAQIREAIAEREWQNHQQQIRNAEEIEHFLTGESVAINGTRYRKASTHALYTWMKREVKGLYGQVFQFAFDIAKKAERALQHELGDPNLSFIQYGYLAGKEGLLAGEKLHFDIKRMEMAFHELNQREYELTKHVSVLQIAPDALLRLRMTGRCTLSLPEELFDFDCPGHYFRRIRTVALSILCVTGPYTSVNCTLRLTKSTIRKSALATQEYPRAANGDDARFEDHYGNAQAIVTSSGQNDSGLFETNLRDERYLPFEGSGVISEWQLELPANPSAREPCPFDYQTIADVILHVRYTARESGAQLRSAALANLKKKIEDAKTVWKIRLFSVRHDFPTEWARFKAAPKPDADADADKPVPYAPLSLKLREEHFPFWSHGAQGSIGDVRLFAKIDKDLDVADKAAAEGRKEDPLTKDPALGNLRKGALSKVPYPKAIGDPLTIFFSDNAMDDLWLAFGVSWNGQ